jgi:hypothetical protein
MASSLPKHRKLPDQCWIKDSRCTVLEGLIHPATLDLLVCPGCGKFNPYRRILIEAGVTFPGAPPTRPNASSSGGSQLQLAASDHFTTAPDVLVRPLVEPVVPNASYHDINTSGGRLDKMQELGVLKSAQRSTYWTDPEPAGPSSSGIGKPNIQPKLGQSIGSAIRTHEFGIGKSKKRSKYYLDAEFTY